MGSSPGRTVRNKDTGVKPELAVEVLPPTIRSDSLRVNIIIASGRQIVSNSLCPDQPFADDA